MKTVLIYGNQHQNRCPNHKTISHIIANRVANLLRRAISAAFDAPERGGRRRAIVKRIQLSVGQQQEAVRRFHRRTSVRDEQNRFPPRLQLVQQLEDDRFGHAVERRSRLVQNHNFSVAQQRPRQRYAKPLSA